MSEYGPGSGVGRDPQPTGATTPFQPAPQPQFGAGQPTAAPQPGGQHPWGPPQPPTAPAYPGYGGHPFPVQQTGTATEEPPAGRRPSRLRIGLVGLVAGALIGGGAGAGVTAVLDDSAGTATSGTAAQNVVIENPETATTATAAAAKAAPSVVTVYVSSGSGAGSGSGVVLTDDGFVLTNNHVVTGGGGSSTVQVRTADGTLYDAQIVGTDPASDLAVLRLDNADGLAPATFADSDEVRVGDVAVAIGAPLGLSNTVTDGIISATDRAVATGSTEDDATVLDALQTDAAINPGNSGGALVNGAGEVIGINTAIATVASGMPGGQSQSGNIGVGFAIPSNTAQRIAQEIVETGSATRALLGVRAQTAFDGQASEVGTGAQVSSVDPDTAASAAGIRAGDVVTAVGDRPVTTATELTAAVRSKAPGEEVTLTVRRGSDTQDVEVTLGSTG